MPDGLGQGNMQPHQKSKRRCRTQSVHWDRHANVSEETEVRRHDHPRQVRDHLAGKECVRSETAVAFTVFSRWSEWKPSLVRTKKAGFPFLLLDRLCLCELLLTGLEKNSQVFEDGDVPLGEPFFSEQTSLEKIVRVVVVLITVVVVVQRLETQTRTAQLTLQRRGRIVGSK